MMMELTERSIGLVPSAIVVGAVLIPWTFRKRLSALGNLVSRVIHRPSRRERIKKARQSHPSYRFPRHHVSILEYDEPYDWDAS